MALRSISNYLFFLVLFLINVHTLNSADFGKLDSSWEKLRHPENDEKWNLGSEGLLTYTNSPVTPNPYRHAYGWFHFHGNYKITPHYSVNGLVTVQKTSFSYNLTDNPFVVRGYPQISFSGTLRDLLDADYLPGSNHNIRMELGVIPMFRHGQGLYFTQFTSGGMVTHVTSKYVNVEFALLGYGFDSKDDVHSLYIYGPGKIFGVGVLSEVKNARGNRIIPGIAGEYQFADFLRLYYETGVSYTYSPSNATQYQDPRYSGSTAYYVDLTRAPLSGNFELNQKTISGLIGFDISMKRFWYIFDRLLLSNQVRTYGKSHTDFYEAQRNTGFNYFYDVTSDQRYNNQPYNFYLYAGGAFGFYLLQELEISPVHYLKFTLRNELLWIRSQNGFDSTGYSPRISGNDLISVILASNVKDKVLMGVKFSNVLIGQYEFYFNAPVIAAGNRGPMFLEANAGILIDFFAHYKI